MENTAKKGPIIALEGGDGTGKTTHIEMILKRFIAERIPDFATISFPRYMTPTGREIRRRLDDKSGAFLRMDPREASKFYGEDRLPTKKVIIAITEAGIPLLLNRWVPSNQGHQGAKILDPQAQRDFIAWEDAYEYGELGLPRPDLIIILHLPAEISQKRAQERDRAAGIESDAAQDNLEHLKAAERAYQVIAEMDPEHTVVVECMSEDGQRELTIEEIHEKIWAIVAPRIR